MSNNQVSWEEVFAEMVKTVNELGCSIEYKDDKEAFGSFSRHYKRITISTDLKGNLRSLETLAHESVHLLQHLQACPKIKGSLLQRFEVYVNYFDDRHSTYIIQQEVEAFTLQKDPLKVLHLLQKKLGVKPSFVGRTLKKRVTPTKVLEKTLWGLAVVLNVGMVASVAMPLLNTEHSEQQHTNVEMTSQQQTEK